MFTINIEITASRKKNNCNYVNAKYVCVGPRHTILTAHVSLSIPISGY